ncbi:MAG: hypothetical protein R6U36_04230 [Candidatus Fermentibacteraceae bacterium]
MRYALVLMAVLALAAFASTEFGFHGGLLLPTGDAGDAYNASPMIGANVLIHMPMYAIEGSISYAFLSSEYDYDNFSASMIPVLAGIRTYMGQVFYGGGLAYHHSSVSWDVEGGDDVDESDGEIGAYGNIGTILPMGGNDIELSGKLHWVDFDDFWLGATAGINI